MRAKVTDRVAPGVVYTTFHYPETQANVVTSEFSDWATNCPGAGDAVERTDRVAGGV